MNLISIYYFLLLMFSFFLYYIVPKQFQKYILLLTSLYFFVQVSLEHPLRFTFIIGYIVVVTYIGGGMSSKIKRKIKKRLCDGIDINACYCPCHFKIFIQSISGIHRTIQIISKCFMA